MEINIISGSNQPETTNVIMGFYNEKDIDVNVDDLSSSDLQAYNDFFDFVGNVVVVKISNCPFFMDCNRVTPVTVLDENNFLDYTLLLPSDKTIVDNFGLIFENI